MRTTIVLMAALLAGCAETGRSGFEAQMAALVGAPEADLRARMGAPAYDHTYAGRRSLAYTNAWTEMRMLPGGGWVEVSRLCEVVFAMNEGRVAGFRTRGDGCGWAGRENFPQKA